EDGLQVGRRVLDHAGALVGRDLDQALGLQLAQRLPYRGAADLEELGELHLAQPVAGRVTAGEYQGSEVVDDGHAYILTPNAPTMGINGGEGKNFAYICQ